MYTQRSHSSRRQNHILRSCDNILLRSMWQVYLIRFWYGNLRKRTNETQTQRQRQANRRNMSTFDHQIYLRQTFNINIGFTNKCYANVDRNMIIRVHVAFSSSHVQISEILTTNKSNINLNLSSTQVYYFAECMLVRSLIFKIKLYELLTTKNKEKLHIGILKQSSVCK